MNWKRGITLMTPTTKRWSKEQIEKNDSIEQTMVFSNFSSMDLGTGRQLICTLNRNNVDYEKNAKLIEAAPELHSTLKEIYDITAGAWDDPVIKEDLYNKMDALIKRLL